MCLLQHLDSHWNIPQRAAYIYPRPGNRQLVLKRSATHRRRSWDELRPVFNTDDRSATGPRLAADHRMMVVDGLSLTALWQMLADHSFWSPTGRTTKMSLTATFFGVPMVADGLWWSVMILVVGGHPLVGPSVWLGLKPWFTIKCHYSQLVADYICIITYLKVIIFFSKWLPWIV